VLIDRTIEVEQAFNSKEKIAEVGIIQHTSMRRDGSLGSRIKRVGKMLFVFNEPGFPIKDVGNDAIAGKDWKEG